MNRQETMKELTRRYLEQQASTAEVRQLLDIIKSGTAEPLIAGLMEDSFRDEVPAGMLAAPNVQRELDALFDQIWARQKSQRPRYHLRYRWLTGAAAAILVLLAIGWFLRPFMNNQELLVSVPVGKTQTITLHDGSTVVLNAGSTLRYPEKFNGDERVVTLEGEGYFKVRSSPGSPGSPLRYEKQFLAPFTVKTQHQAVTVLGTEFNVKAYPADSLERVSLITGKVQVKADGETLILQPGQQEVYAQGNTHVASVQPEAAFAWKDGFFDFYHKPATEVLQELSRWYGFELLNTAAIPDKELVGRIPKTMQLKTVLALLREAGMHFRMEDNKRMIML